MTDYASFEGISGPVTTAGFVGAFTCNLLAQDMKPSSMYISINAPRALPIFFSFCTTQKVINKLVVTTTPPGSTQKNVSNWAEVRIERIFPPLFPLYPTSEGDLCMIFSYHAAALHPATQLVMLNKPFTFRKP